MCLRVSDHQFPAFMAGIIYYFFNLRATRVVFGPACNVKYPKAVEVWSLHEIEILGSMVLNQSGSFFASFPSVFRVFQ